jgi:hypothetical protein
VVYLGDHSKLKALEAYDADFSAADYSGRTALHVAASTGQAGLGTTLIKRTRIFLIYEEIQIGSQSHMRKGFLINEEMHKYFHRGR